MAEGEEPEDNGYRIILSLDRLGELIALVATRFAEIREIEPPDLSGPEGRILARAGYERVLHMCDRAQFEASVAADLAALVEVPESE